MSLSTFVSLISLFMPHSLGLLIDKTFLICLKQGVPRQSVEGASRLQLKQAEAEASP